MAVRGRVDDPGGGTPAGFADAQAALRRARVRPEVLLGEAPAPQRLAPFSIALTAEVMVDGEELATGRLVVLHDPDGQEAWHGVTRLVAYAKAECEPEMVADPLLPSVGWAWLTEALEARGAAAVALSGTVTRVASESFGGLADAGRGATAELELRASWTPLGDDLDHHVEAWADLLCTAAGLPPVPQGVATLRPRRRS
ncbi:MAG: hypothetical protein QOK42_2081 [Frankiaceae bacterium]|jgi:hypothetical protein|nr:hypothetical protein [Frankiaceae bacterium]MDX6275408.1 hypothetical protein [Frankiales bacterium]